MIYDVIKSRKPENISSNSGWSLNDHGQVYFCLHSAKRIFFISVLELHMVLWRHIMNEWRSFIVVDHD